MSHRYRSLCLVAPFLTLACTGEPADDFGGSLQGDVRLRSATWEQFPIVLHGVTAHDLDNYQIEIDGADRTLGDLIDVATYFTVFQPCGSDLDSFNYSMAEAYIDAASSEGVHVRIPLPYLGATSNACDGVTVGGELWDETETIQIPLNKNQITTQYISYWATRAGTFIDAVDHYDSGNVVWSWGGLDELRYWYPTEVGLARAMRSAVDSHDGTRFLTAYTPNHYMPESSLVSTLVDRPHASLAPNDPLSVTLDPLSPVARDAVAGAVHDYYPRSVLANRNSSGELRNVFDHLWTGAYTGWVLGVNGHENRIHPYHRARLSAETIENVASVYAANNAAESLAQDVPQHLVLHGPDLSAAGPHEMSSSEARHDLWAGVHVADGVWLYSFAYHDDSANHEAVWASYAEAFYLIKTELREYLVNGTKTSPSIWHNGTVNTVPGDGYTGLPVFANHDFLALPDGEYDVFNRTFFSIGDVGYLVVTHSWNQEADLKVYFPSCVSHVEIVNGAAENLFFHNNAVGDTFSGIDGRVYRVELGDSC